jgi:hypothetical protein
VYQGSTVEAIARDEATNLDGCGLRRSSRVIRSTKAG